MMLRNATISNSFPLWKISRNPVYILTPTGKKILELLEEIERVYKEGVSEEEKFEKVAEEYLYDGEK